MYAPPSNLFEPMPTFIETQFPIARLSAESYKERKANNGQTLTRLGKWWGRKPLVLVRASILGMLMPASADAKRDREIFLKILTMDDEGTWLRCKDHSASVPWRTAQGPSRAVFDALPYAERISYCDRPENVEGPSEEAWSDINAHLGTTGTVCLVLRKRAANEPGFLDEVYPLVEDEVKRQIASMQALDEGGEPNFNDADYQLAAYAAALKVLTHYGTLDGKDVEHEVFAVRERHAKSDFQVVIERALGIACDTLIPRGLDASWRDLSLVERYYLRSLDIESRGERRMGMYEELARGFGVTDIRPLLKSDKANGARMFTPSGLAASLLGLVQGADASSGVGGVSATALPAGRGRASAAGPHPFASAPLRHLMFAVRETAAADNSPEPGRQYLRDTFGQGYWGKREGFIGLLEWLAALGNAQGMDEWVADSEAARILAGRLRNDHA